MVLVTGIRGILDRIIEVVGGVTPSRYTIEGSPLWKTKRIYVRPILHKKSQAVGKRPSLVDPVHNSHRERKAYDFGWILEFY